MSDYSVLIGGMRDLLGDLAADEWDAGVLDRCLRMALGRYGQVFERVECSLTQLANGGLHNLELTFSGLTIPKEVAYLHWPAASSIPATTAENRLLDWWVWYASTAAAPTVFKPRFGFQVSGAALPAANDYVLYYGILDHQIDGMTPEEAAADARRCLRCDCRKPHDCALRRLADAYGARDAGAPSVKQPVQAIDFV